MKFNLSVELVEEEIVEMDDRMVATFEELRNHDEEQPETSHENDVWHLLLFRFKDVTF